MAKAQELVLTAKKILGPEAAEIGLANKSVAAEEVLAEARAMAAEIATIDPHVLEYAKRALHFGAAHSMAAAMKNEQRQSAELKAVRDRARTENESATN
jgi:enoyl-CoA hydratase/carnithine racemase